MRQKMKPDYDPEEVQAELIEAIATEYSSGSSIRTVAKTFSLSPMKVRKLLITGGVYSTEYSEQIAALYKDGKTVAEIAEILHTTTANINSYLPYERIVYKMDEKSVEADRQQRYRDRKKGLLPPISAPSESSMQEIPKEIQRVRDKTMIIIVGQKLRRMLPADVFDNTSDPLARENAATLGGYEGGRFVLHVPADPDKSIWCAEATVAGRGKNKKVGVVLMSANCGFIVVSELPTAPALINTDELEQMDYVERCNAREQNEEAIDNYRKELETTFINAIRKGFLDFCLPENRVLDYTDTIARVELIKGRRSTPGVRLEEWIERYFNWKPDDDPVKLYNVKSNWGTRKFGNSGGYRHVEEAVHSMLAMDNSESLQWMTDFMKPMTEKVVSE